MNADQIRSCAEDIVEEKWYLRIDDIDLCLRRGMLLEYGEIYNRMDQSVIFGWLKKYETERDSHLSKVRDENHRNNVYEIWQEGPLLDIVRDVANKLSEKEVEKVISEKVTRQRSMVDDWIDEFDFLFKGQPEDDSPIKTVKYNGKTFDLTGYVEIRNLEYMESLKEAKNE